MYDLWFINDDPLPNNYSLTVRHAYLSVAKSKASLAAIETSCQCACSELEYSE